MKTILLTWCEGDIGTDQFGWFESEKEAKKFIELTGFYVMDAIEIISSRDIEI